MGNPEIYGRLLETDRRFLSEHRGGRKYDEDGPEVAPDVKRVAPEMEFLIAKASRASAAMRNSRGSAFAGRLTF